MTILGIDTSNYATSLAVFRTKPAEVVCDKKRFLPVKDGALGLRQSDAVFHHTSALPALLRELDEQAPLSEVGAVGVSTRPRSIEGSYMPCFLTGVSIAQAIGLARGVQVFAFSHQQGHMAAALYAAGGFSLFTVRTLVFHVSGGTTDLLLCEHGSVLQTLGTSTDLYAGQAVDRIGVRMGLAFPAGAALSALAAQCDEPITPKVSVRGMDCSLSGLENQCDALLKKGAPQAYVAKYCLAAIGETTRKMLSAAREQYPDAPMVCAGGVMSSEIVRAQVQQTMPEARFVPAKFASDNAIGVAILAAGQVGQWQM